MSSSQANPVSERAPGTDSPPDLPRGARAFAWAGWWLPVPETFRLHDIEGNARRGRLALADGDRVRLELAWDAVTSRRFDGERFAQRQLRRALKHRDRKSARIDRVGNDAFQPMMRLAVPVGEWEHHAGFCPVTRRALVLRYRTGTRPENETVARSIRDRLRGQSLDEGQRWAFFSVHFKAPPGFEYEQATLNLGDMTVQLVQRRRGRMPRVVVRQIHPARLALTRFNLDGWLEHLLGAEHRTFRPTYRKRFPLRDPVIDRAGCLLGPCAVADSRMRPALRAFMGLRHHPHRRSWLIHDEAGDRLVFVQVDHHRDQLQSVFESVCQGLHRAECHA